MSRDNELDPSVLAAYDEESKYLNSSSGTRHRLKIERGQTYLLRWLPVELGPRKLWYARIARHWISKKPHICPKHTHPDFGGDPDAYCPICDTVEKHSHKDLKLIKQMEAVTQFYTFALVRQKGDSVIEGDERWVPWEYWLYRSVFNDLFTFFKNGLKRRSLSVLDLYEGNDIWVSNGRRGTRLDRDDSSPVASSKDPAKVEAILDKIYKQIKPEKFTIPQESELEKIADKLDEYLSDLRAGDDDRNGGRGRDDMDDEDEPRSHRRHNDDDDGAPRSRRGADDLDDNDGPHPRRPASRQTEDEAPRRPARQVDEDEAPRRPARQSADDDDARDEAPRRPAPRHDDDDGPRQRPTAKPSDPDDDINYDDKPAAPATGLRRVAPPPAARVTAPAARQEAPASARRVPSTVSDEDTVADEQRDPAPAEAAASAAVEDEAPPTIRKASKLSSRLRGNLKAADQEAE